MIPAGVENELEKILKDMRSEVIKARENLTRIEGDLNKHKEVTQENFRKVTEDLQKYQDAINKQNKALAYLDKRLGEVRTDSSSGIVATIVIFTVLFIISLVL